MPGIGFADEKPHKKKEECCRDGGHANCIKGGRHRRREQLHQCHQLLKAERFQHKKCLIPRHIRYILYSGTNQNFCTQECLFFILRYFGVLKFIGYLGRTGCTFATSRDTPNTLREKLREKLKGMPKTWLMNMSDTQIRRRRMLAWSYFHAPQKVNSNFF